MSEIIMKPISVIIPTINRPKFLEMALASVARQTAVYDIEEVIVSENKDNRASEAVCAKFNNLPIKYIFQNPPLSESKHFENIIQVAKAEFIAILSDDDWWGAGHLQTSLNTLRNSPEASACFSASLFVESEEAIKGWIFRNPVIWLAAGKPKYSVPWKLEPGHIFASTYIFTPFHISSMVVRREILIREFDEVLKSHPWYSDRILYPCLARSGLIIYKPFVEVFIRRHSGNWHMDKSKKELYAANCEGSEKIFNLAAGLGFDIYAIWEQFFAEASEDLREELAGLLFAALDKKGLHKHGFDKFLRYLPNRRWQDIIKIMLRYGLPPALLELYRKGGGLFRRSRP